MRKLLWAGLASLLMGGVSGLSAAAQIVPDRSLGNERSRVRETPVTGRDGIVRDSDVIEGGARRRSNLFHSFRRFDVPEGRGAYFDNPNGVENIFSRVTGNSRSQIFGTLGVLGDANLFLLNPNGILFGPNASLDLGGSFTATTASAIRFGEQSFSAIRPQAPSGLLTINPSAFLFNQVPPGNIVSHAAGDFGLQVTNGQNLTLLGGDVVIRDGKLNAWGGRVELGAVAGEGTVKLTGNDRLLFPDDLSRADLLFNGALVDVSLDDGGNINVVGNRIDIENGSRMQAGIDSSRDNFNSQAGDIRLSGNIIRVIQGSQIDNDVNETYSGNAGDIRINSNSLIVRGGAQLSASTFGRGNAGNVLIHAGQINFDGISTDGQFPSAAFSTVDEDGRGQGGNVEVTADSLSLSHGAALSTSTLGRDLTPRKWTVDLSGSGLLQ